MTLVLRKQHAEERIEGRKPPPDLSDEDYAIVDETLVGRIQRCKMISSGCGSYRQCRPLPNQGIADTLEEAKAAWPRAMNR